MKTALNLEPIFFLNVLALNSLESVCKDFVQKNELVEVFYEVFGGGVDEVDLLVYTDFHLSNYH